MRKGGKQCRAKLHFLGINNTEYGALNQSVKNTWLTQQVNTFPKSYTETAKLVDQFSDPNTGKHVSASTQLGVAFIQTVQPPHNNRQRRQLGEDGSQKTETGKRSDKKGGEA